MIRRAQRAFTLLEILLAVCVASILMTAASYLVMSFSTIWTLRTDEDAFEEHADGVSDFLQKGLDESCSRYQPKWKAATDSTGSKGSDDDQAGETDSDDAGTRGADAQWTNSGASMKKIEDGDSIETPLLHFNFFTLPPALGATLPAGTPGVEAWIKFDEKRGLFLVWKDIWSIQDNPATDERDLLRSSLISPMVTEFEYVYRDPDMNRWQAYKEPQSMAGTYTLPDFIRITFTEKDRSVTRLVRIPKRVGKMPLF